MNQHERSKLSVYLKMDFWPSEYACRLFAEMDPETKASLEVEGRHSYDPWRTQRNNQYEMYKQLWENSDHSAYIETAGKGVSGEASRIDKFKVSYCLQWALQKGILIPWLDWAEENGLVGERRWEAGYTDESTMLIKTGEPYISTELMDMLLAASAVWNPKNNPKTPSNKDVEAFLKRRGWKSGSRLKAAASIIRPDHLKGKKA